MVDCRFKDFWSSGGTSNIFTCGGKAANVSEIEVEVQEKVEEEDGSDLDEYEQVVATIKEDMENEDYQT